MRYVTIFTLLCLFIFTSSFAGIIYVPNDTTSIQGGIHLASNGDTVLVADGTYIENISFKGKAITVASHFLMDGDTNHINNTNIDGSQSTNPDSGSVVCFVFGRDLSRYSSANLTHASACSTNLLIYPVLSNGISI